jgi:hypothetical protein
MQMVRLQIVVFIMVFALASQTCMGSWATIKDSFSWGFSTDPVYFSEEKDGIRRHVRTVGRPGWYSLERNSKYKSPTEI